MSILLWIAIGLIGGLAAGWLSGLRGRALLGDVAAGVLGGFIGGFMAAVLLGLDIAEFEGTSSLTAAVGAAVLILVVHALPAVDVYE